MDKIEALCNYLDKNVAKLYPVSNRSLSDSTDYMKNGYLKLLAVVMQQSGKISPSQLGMFGRIVEGAGVEYTADDYIRMALEIEIDEFVEFSRECRENSLRYRWALDAIILTCVQTETPEQVRLIAQICEAYGILKDELQYIAAMAKAIVEMSISDYVTAYELKADSVPDSIFADYIYLISKTCVCSNDNMTIFQPSCKEDVTTSTLDKLQNTDTPSIRIIGAEISLKDYNLKIHDKKNIIFEDCTFTGGANFPLEFTACEKVVIRNCRFSDFSSRTIVMSDIEEVLIDGCEFNKCILIYSYSRLLSNLGGVIAKNSDTVKKLDIINTLFVECGGLNKASDCASACICNIVSNVDKCKFVNCWHRHTRYGDVDVDRESEYRTLFAKGSLAVNCEYDNSALFN